MKKTYCAALVAVLVAASVAGCKLQVQSKPTELAGGDLAVYRDPLTGCEYLAHHRGGLVPRTNVDGRQLCTP